ncbi:MAG: glycosyltransferase family 4 protein [Bacteroidia bacterium]
MRILYFSPHPTHDIASEVGYSTHQRETILAFRVLGHEVLPVIMGGTTKEEKKVFQQQGLKFRIKEAIKKAMPEVFYNGLKDYGIRRFDQLAAQKLEEGIRTFKPDLVYERSEYMQDSGVRVCRALGVKHYLEVNAPFIEEMRHWEGPSVLHPLGHRIEKRKIKEATRVFAVSSVLRDFLVDEYDADPEKLAVIPNCINPDGVKVEPEKAAAIAAQYGLNGKRVVGFVGSFFPHHGLDDLIAAFARVEHDFPEAVLMIVGGGMNEEELRRQAVQQLGEGRVIFAGRVPHHEVYNYITHMDIAVMPRSNWYGSPMKIFEYGILAKAVVAPDNGPVKDAMVHGEDGILIQPGKEALADALRLLLADKALCERLGAHFEAKIRERFVWTKQAEYILGL